MAKCPNCGSDNPEYSFYCGKCAAELKDSSGKPYVEPKRAPPPLPKKVVPKVVEVMMPAQTVNPVIGGVCVIIAGALAMLQGGMMLIGEAFITVYAGELTGAVGLFGVGFLVVGLMSVLFGIWAVGRLGYTRSLLGAVLGILGMGFGIGPFFALAGLILIALSRNEFTQ